MRLRKKTRLQAHRASNRVVGFFNIYIFRIRFSQSQRNFEALFAQRFRSRGTDR